MAFERMLSLNLSRGSKLETLFGAGLRFLFWHVFTFNYYFAS